FSRNGCAASETWSSWTMDPATSRSTATTRPYTSQWVTKSPPGKCSRRQVRAVIRGKAGYTLKSGTKAGHSTPCPGSQVVDPSRFFRPSFARAKPVEHRNMRNRLKQAGLVVAGVLAGVLLSLNFSAVAQREAARYPLPVDEL